MDVKGGVHNLRKLEEVGISCGGSTASKDTLQKVGEFGKSPWLVRENEITVALNVHLVVQHRFQRYPSEGWRIRQESMAGKRERNHRRPQRPSCSPARSALACCLRR